MIPCSCALFPSTHVHERGSRAPAKCLLRKSLSNWVSTTVTVPITSDNLPAHSSHLQHQPYGWVRSKKSASLEIQKLSKRLVSHVGNCRASSRANQINPHCKLNTQQFTLQKDSYHVRQFATIKIMRVLCILLSPFSCKVFFFRIFDYFEAIALLWPNRRWSLSAQQMRFPTLSLV